MIHLPRPPAPVYAAVAIVALTWSQFVFVSSTNFWGYDEWVNLYMVSRGILGFPYADRPLMLVWNVPARLWSDLVAGHYVLHGTYLALSGVATFLLVRRLAPERPLLAWLTGAFAATWAPSDRLRLDSIWMLAYSGVTFGVLLALWLLAEAWSRRRTALVVAAAAVAVVAARGYEPCVPLLLGAPLLLAAVARPRGPRAWWAVWYGALAAAIAQLLVTRLTAPDGVAYQTGFEPGASPLAVAARLLRHAGYALLPLAQVEWRELLVPAVVPALAAFALGLALVRPRADRSLGDARGLAIAMAFGAALAALGWAAYTLSAALTTPDRTQFLAAPGVGLLLAATTLWLASWLPERWRPLAAAALAGWVMWVGTGRLLAMERTWTEHNRYPAQVHLMRELTRLAPDLRPNTLVVLLDRTDAWRAFGFEYAVAFTYGGRAWGHLWGPRGNFLSRTTFGDAGVVREPLAAIREPWSVEPTFHRYDEVLVVRYAADGTVEILDEWPGRIRRLPPGATYAPGPRIVRDGPVPSSRAVLRGTASRPEGWTTNR